MNPGLLKSLRHIQIYTLCFLLYESLLVLEYL